MPLIIGFWQLMMGDDGKVFTWSWRGQFYIFLITPILLMKFQHILKLCIFSYTLIALALYYCSEIWELNVEFDSWRTERSVCIAIMSPSGYRTSGLNIGLYHIGLFKLDYIVLDSLSSSSLSVVFFDVIVWPFFCLFLF